MQGQSPSNVAPCEGPTVNTEEDTWITLAMAIVVLPLCAFFLVNTWKRWLAAHRRSSSVSSTPTGSSHHPAGSHRHSLSAGHTDNLGSKSGSYLARHHNSPLPTESHGQQSIMSIRSAASSAMLALRTTWLDSIIYWTRKMIRPRGLNQLLGNLLLSSWTILALDQLFHSLFILSVTFVCPAYNCRTYRSFASPGCPAGLFEGIQLFIQPFGSCLFIVATLNRFVNVYSQLSRRRFIALRVGTTIVVLVCTAMSIVTALAYSVVSATSSTSEQATQAHELLLLGDFITYSSIGIVSILALIMGLEYVVKIRKEVNALRPSIATPSVFQPKELAAKDPRGAHIKASASLVTSPSTSPSLGEPLALTSPLNPNPRSSIPSNPDTQYWSKDKRKSVVTVCCIIVNMTIIVLFLTEHPYMKKPAGNTPASETKTSALLDSAFMSMCHKIFAGTVTVAIHQMTDLVLSANHK